MINQNSNRQTKRVRAVYGNYLICIFQISNKFEYNLWNINDETIDHIEHRKAFSSSNEALAYGVIRMHMLNQQDELGFGYSVMFLD